MATPIVFMALGEYNAMDVVFKNSSEYQLEGKPGASSCGNSSFSGVY